jgi:hypothetical protein
VVTYGVGAEADVRGENVTAAWPDRLRLTIAVNGKRHEVQTQLCGTHMTHCVLAAVATGMAMGIPVRECVRALTDARPFPARMEPVTTEDGITFVQDDWKAAVWTTSPAFRFMQEARAARKVIVVGTLSDYRGSASVRYARVARAALEVADHVVFVGPWASRALRAAGSGQRGTLSAFSSVWQAHEHLRGVLRAGDLVLLKGTNRKDHLRRIVLARSRDVRCWRDDCGKFDFCGSCPSVSIASGGAGVEAPSSVDDRRANLPVWNRRGTVVVGLGNPGARYADTPHNVGHGVLDALARHFQAGWIDDIEASIATAVCKLSDVCLIKLQAGVNKSGAALQRLDRQMRLGIENVILVTMTSTCPSARCAHRCGEAPADIVA